MIDVVAERIVRKNPFLKEWPYYGIIDVLNPVATAQYQHAVTIASKPGMAHNFRDLRFFQADGTEIPFWIESKTDGSTAFVWFKPHSASNRQAYVFYGNREAVSQSNGDKVFEVFDDFLGSSLDATKWTVSNTPTVSSSILTVNDSSGNEKLVSAYSATPGYAIRTYAAITRASYAYILWANSSATPWMGIQGVAGKLCTNMVSGTPIDFNPAISDDNYHTYEVRRYSTKVDVIADGTQRGTENPADTTSALNVWIYAEDASSSPQILCDWILVRKYTATEPVCQLNQSGLRNPAYR